MRQMNTNESNIFSKNIIELKLISDRLAEGKGENSQIFSNMYQILYIIEKKEIVTPKELMAELNIAKSNLAILARKMINDGQIESHKDLNNRREIYYSITPLGSEQLKLKLDSIEASCAFDSKKINNILTKAIEELRKLENKNQNPKKKKASAK